jgi:hypothetical protein
MPAIAASATIPLTSSGPILFEALQQPVYTLRFYAFGVTLEYIDPATSEQTSYAINPADLTAIFGTESLGFSSGLLADDIIYTGLHSGRQQLLSYRPPQITGIYLEGSATPLRVPLPGMMLYRAMRPGDQRPDYRLFAVKQRPTTLDEPLYLPPLPNIYSGGSICWGTVERPVSDAPTVSLAADWAQLLGSTFGSHMVDGKSKLHPDDIRQHFIALDAAKADVYPLGDLIPARNVTTLRDVLAVQHD